MLTSINNNTFQGSIKEIKRPERINTTQTVDTVSFKGKERPPEKEKTDFFGFLGKFFSLITTIIKSIINFLFKNSTEILEEKINQNWHDKPSDIKIEYYNSPLNRTKVQFDPEKRHIKINSAYLSSDYTDLDYINDAKKLLNIDPEKLERLNHIYKKTAEKIGFERPEFVPNLTLSITQDFFGTYITEHNSLEYAPFAVENGMDNTAWASIVFAHELTHAKRMLTYSLFDTKPLITSPNLNSLQKKYIKDLNTNPVFEKYRKYRAEHKPLHRNIDELRRISNDFLEFMTSISFVDRNAGDYYNRGTVTTNFLKTVKEKFDLNDEEGALLNIHFFINPHDEKITSLPIFKIPHPAIQNIANKLKPYEKQLLKLCNASLTEVQKDMEYVKKYQHSLEEATARQMSGLITKQNLEDGTISNEEEVSNLSGLFYADIRDHAFLLDSEVRQMISAGSIQLDKETLDYILANNAIFNLNLSAQKNIE